MSETPQRLFDEAFDLNFALYRNACQWTEVIAWADDWISRLDQWPDEIIEISLNGSRKDSTARHALARLAESGKPQHGPEKLVRLALQQLELGREPAKIISDLYPLVYEEFSTGGVTFKIETPEVIRTAIYVLDHDLDNINPEYGWNKMEPADGDHYMRERVQTVLTDVIRDL